MRIPIHARAETEKCANLLDPAGNFACGIFAHSQGRGDRLNGPERLGEERVLSAGFGLPGNRRRYMEGGIRHELCTPWDGGEVSVAWVFGSFHCPCGGVARQGSCGG